MGISYKTIFLFIACVFVINLSIAAPPIQYNEIKNVSIGEGLNGVFYINDTASNYNIWQDSSNIYIENPTGATGVTLKAKYQPLVNKFGNVISLSHKNNLGIIDSTKLINLGEPDVQGFIYLYNLDFSTIIIGGVSAPYSYSQDDWVNGTIKTFSPSFTAKNIINFKGTNISSKYSGKLKNGSTVTFDNRINVSITTNGSAINSSYELLLEALPIPASQRASITPNTKNKTYLEFFNDSGNATHTNIFVNLNYSIANGNSDYIYILYNNSGIADQSNGADTFPIHFNDSVATFGEGVVISSSPTNWIGKIVEVKINTPSSQGAGLMLSTAVSNFNGVQWLVDSSGDDDIDYYDGAYHSLIDNFGDGPPLIMVKKLINTTAWNSQIYWAENRSLIAENLSNLGYRGTPTVIDTFWTLTHGSLTYQTYFYHIIVRQYIENEPIIGYDLSGSDNTNIYFVVNGINISENKTISTDNVELNYTIPSQLTIDNVTIYINNSGNIGTGTFNFTLVGNYTIISETHTAGYQNITLNFTSSYDLDEINLSVNFTDYNDFLIDSANATASNGSISCTGLNCTLNSTNYVNNTLFQSLLSFQYFNTATVTAPVVGTDTINLNSTTFPGVTGYFFRYAHNGTSNYNYSNVTTSTTQLTNLTLAETYDIWVAVNKSGGTLSDWSAKITVTTSSGDVALDAVLVQIEENHQETLAEIEETKELINALWGGMLMSGILVIGYLSHIRRKIKEDKDYD